MNRKPEIVEIAGIGPIAVAVWTVLTMLSDASLAEVYAMFFKGIFGNLDGLMEVFVKAIPLISTGLGCAVAFRTGFFNIGAKGQFYIGALTSAQAALIWTRVPGGLRILCAILMGFVFDGLWALIAAIFKAGLGISEIIVTIMLNYIAINFLGIAVRTFLMDPAGSIPQLPKLDPSITPYWPLKPTRLHTGFIIAVLMVFLVWFILEETTVKYEIKVVGFNKRAAACDGISVVRNIIISAFLSGGLAGIAGAAEAMGAQRKLLEGISGECGHTAVLIALLASNHPVGVLFAAIGFAVLEMGTNSMQGQMGVLSAIANILVGLIVLLILGRELFNRKRKEEKPCQSKS